MKKIVVLFLIFSSSLFAQKEANIWYFGEYAGLDFNSGSPKLLLDGKLNAEGGCATISDTNGNLLFYSDGRTVWNRNHQIMLNGTGLNGGTRSTHSAIVVPKPNEPNKYYIFTVDDFIGNNGLQYSEVDMTLDSGLGGITSTKNILLHTPTTEKITAVKSAVANEYWVVSHKWGNNEFIAFKVTSSGVNLTPVISGVGTIVDNDGASIGQIKIAPNGKKIAVARFPSISEVQIFDFDNATGKISNPLTLLKYSNDEQIYGLEFSPNSQLLYTAVNYKGIFQFNLNAGSSNDIVNSKVKLFTTDTHHDSFQLASNGKIYIVGFAQSYLDVINNPNTIGLGANYVEEAVYLGGRISFSGLPVFIQSFFTINFQSKNHCLGDATNFKVSNTQTYDSILWNFGDGTTSNQENPTHTYNQTGTYSVTLSVTSGINVSVETQEVTIYKSPSAKQPTNIAICDDDNNGFYNFNLTSQTNAILNGQSTDEFEIDYFASMTDYINAIKISNYTNYKNTTAYQEQTIVARVRNKQDSNCEAITSFKIQVFEMPKPKESTLIPSLSDCDNTSVGTDIDGKIVFNLTSRETEILNGQKGASFIITYYLDKNLTQKITTPANFINSNTSQRIYVKIVNKMQDKCFSKTSFLLNVYELPTVISTVSLKQCDNTDINGFSLINLNEAKSKVVSDSKNFTITFFEDKMLAENNTSPILNPTTYTNQAVSNDKVWARIENKKGCYRISEVSLIISTTQIPSNFLKTFYECDDGEDTKDGIATFNFNSITEKVKDLFPENQQLIIKYYKNENDALTELNEISNTTNYKNIGYPNQQKIYIRVDSKLDNDCLGLGHHITLNVEKVPKANSVTINPQCDSDGDGLYAFDTSTIQNKIIGNQTGVSVNYFNDKNVALPSPLPNPFYTVSQTITAKIINTDAKDTDGKCSDETTIEFVVNAVPIANTISPQIQCDNNFDGIASFDTGAIESTVLGNQTGVKITYFDIDNKSLPSPLPNPFNTETQKIKVRVENSKNTNCFNETIIDFVVRRKPDFDLDNEAVICITTNSILEVMAESPNGNYSYEWKDENDTVISNSIEATITEAGFYHVKATSEYGCISDTKNIQVKKSETPRINIENITIIDDSANNSIKIDKQNIGLGDYVFGLLDSNSNIVYDYQETPYFDSLRGGVYTILIKDINGCGIQSIETAIITYPKFFTPNNDGFNDTWKILDLEKSYYKSGEIKIFNRFGRVLKILSLNDTGWSGFYRGKRLPSSDYWFQIELTDPKGNIIIKKGNFSLLER